MVDRSSSSSSGENNLTECNFCLPLSSALVSFFSGCVGASFAADTSSRIRMWKEITRSCACCDGAGGCAALTFVFAAGVSFAFEGEGDRRLSMSRKETTIEGACTRLPAVGEGRDLLSLRCPDRNNCVHQTQINDKPKQSQQQTFRVRRRNPNWTAERRQIAE